VELAAGEAGPSRDSAASGQIVSLPWSRKPFRATKGVIGGAAAVTNTPADGQAVLVAIGRARRWVDEIMAGGTVAGIASREGKGERQVRLLVPLVFTPPDIMRQLLDSSMPTPSVTELARRIPLIWQAGPDPVAH
jgi:site-specific DNA recombinase